MFTLEIDTDNDAFADPNSEVARILRRLADRLEELSGAIGTGIVKDVNGNTVGKFTHR